MTGAKHLFLAAIVALTAAMGGAQTSMPQPPTPPASGASVTELPSSVRILAPKNAEVLTTPYVDVRFELVNPGVVGGTPTFRVRLDSRDPVDTTSTEQIFTGLTPGTHTVSVQVVDANGTPVPGTRTELQFIVPGQKVPSGPAPAATLPPSLVPVALQARESQGNKGNDDPNELPESSSSLPLLAVVGFGVLAGGITSVMRTR